MLSQSGTIYNRMTTRRVSTRKLVLFYSSTYKYFLEKILNEKFADLTKRETKFTENSAQVLVDLEKREIEVKKLHRAFVIFLFFFIFLEKG